MVMTQAEVTSNQSSQGPVTASQILGPVETPKDDTPTGVDPALQKPGEEKLSPKLQVLIARERAAVEKERTASAKEKEIASKLQELEARELKLKEFETLKETSPLKALELLGLSYQDLTQAALSDGNVPVDVKLKKLEDLVTNKFDSFEKTQVEALKRQEEEQKQIAAKREQEALDGFKTQIANHLKENSSRYEFIEFEQASDLVFDVIDEHYNRTIDPETGVGKVLTIAEAADKVEAHLEQKYDKARSLKKVIALLARQQEKPAAKPQNEPRQQPKTLNNQLTPAQPAAKRTTPISDEERIAKAIAYARGLRP